MKKIIALLAGTILLSCAHAPAFAQSAYRQVPNTPTITVPDYGMKVGIWAYDTLAVGQGVGLFEQHVDGSWYKFGGAGPYDPFQPMVTAAGGPKAYVTSLLPALNAAIALRFPPISGPPAATGNDVLDPLNQALYSSFQFKQNADGTTVLVGK